MFPPAPCCVCSMHRSRDGWPVWNSAGSPQRSRQDEMSGGSGGSGGIRHLCTLSIAAFLPRRHTPPSLPPSLPSASLPPAVRSFRASLKPSRPGRRRELRQRASPGWDGVHRVCAPVTPHARPRTDWPVGVCSFITINGFLARMLARRELGTAGAAGRWCYILGLAAADGSTAPARRSSTWGWPAAGAEADGDGRRVMDDDDAAHRNHRGPADPTSFPGGDRSRTGAVASRDCERRSR